MSEQTIPYKIYLAEDEIPKQWYNLRADMKNKPAPLLNPATLKPMGFDDLRPVFCDELVKQELDEDTHCPHEQSGKEEGHKDMHERKGAEHLNILPFHEEHHADAKGKRHEVCIHEFEKVHETRITENP